MSYKLRAIQVRGSTSPVPHPSFNNLSTMMAKLSMLVVVINVVIVIVIAIAIVIVIDTTTSTTTTTNCYYSVLLL